MDLPDFNFEEKLWQRGFRFVAGADEVGRGSFAGPVVAAAVVFEPTALALSSRAFGSQKGANRSLVQINDSKKLRPRQREKAAIWIKENAYSWAIGASSVAEINKLGVGKATQIAFRRAIAGCELDIEYLLIDAFYVPYLRGLNKRRQKPIVKGDSLSVSIAAASIIAKVERDGLMRKLSRQFKEYRWGKNKGYGTKEHREAIKKYGTTKHHRRAFTTKWQDLLTTKWQAPIIDSSFSRVLSDA
ncbi:MAG: Ribonuclease HII [Candidatus Woesebacteria bacterium GW2011_GWB1_44_11b]|uniref:Ribonuclease HII n=1 Tax=Candidatus Woesebacteria bacterium GW2011_GWB1_44_11b TaxID=1618580 RepID=A0A0G1GGG0_9BACT|nr:MAG: Ribonuclease HII [Candidatus Woesebacteria bacterium GW2011_GWB1_44_11b]